MFSVSGLKSLKDRKTYVGLCCVVILWCWLVGFCLFALFVFCCCCWVFLHCCVLVLFFPIEFKNALKGINNPSWFYFPHHLYFKEEKL